MNYVDFILFLIQQFITRCPNAVRDLILFSSGDGPPPLLNSIQSKPCRGTEIIHCGDRYSAPQTLILSNNMPLL